jgi:hypothetical protein
MTGIAETATGMDMTTEETMTATEDLMIDIKQ